MTPLCHFSVPLSRTTHVWYVDHNSLWLDARIVGSTILRLVSREGVSNQGHATMPLFRGSK
jgi:lipopolysaccharide/colanic/teichoic acid biosynthesis glycosyltransferase